MRILITFITLTILLFSCGEYKEVSFTGVNSFKVEKANDKGFNLLLNVRVNNPNKYSIHVKGSDLGLYVGQSKVGDATLKKGITLKKNSFSDYDVVIHTNIKQLTGGGMTGILGSVMSGGIQLKIAGNLKASAKGLSTKIPIEYTQNLSLDDLGKFMQQG